MVDTLPDVVAIAEGENNGRYWRVEAVFAYADAAMTQGGYVRLVDADGNVTEDHVTLPFEAPYECLPKLATDGVGTVVGICRYSNVGFTLPLN